MAGNKRKQPADGHGSGPISKKPRATPRRVVPLHEMHQLHALRTPEEVKAVRNNFKAKLKRQSNGMEGPKLEAFIQAAQYTPSCLAHTITTTASINSPVNKVYSPRSIHHARNIAKLLATEYQPSVVAHTDSTMITRIPPPRIERLRQARSLARHYTPSVLAHTIYSGTVMHTRPPRPRGRPLATAGAVDSRDSTTYAPASTAHMGPTPVSSSLARAAVTPPQVQVPVDRNAYGGYHISQNARHMFLTFAMVPTLVPSQPTSAPTTLPSSTTITPSQNRMSRKQVEDDKHYLPSIAAHTIFSSISLGLAVGASTSSSKRGSGKVTKGAAFRRPLHTPRSFAAQSGIQNSVTSRDDDSLFLPQDASHSPTANSHSTSQNTNPEAPGLYPVTTSQGALFQAREPKALHPKSLAVWGGTGQTDPRNLKPELRRFIDSDGYIDPSAVYEINHCQCPNGCGKTYHSLKELANHVLYGLCYGSRMPDCDFELSLQNCNGHAGLHRRLNDYHYYLNHSIDCRCGRAFPTIFHAIEHIYQTRHDHEVLPTDQCRPLLRFTIDTFGSLCNYLVTESGRGFFTRTSADLSNDDLEYKISRTPLYPQGPYTIFVKRHSSHYVSSMASPVALQIEYQSLTGINNNVITYQIPHCHSHQFPLVFAPPISHWLADTMSRLGGSDPTHERESEFIQKVFRNVRETAELHNLISQCPSALPLVLSIADGFSCHLELLAFFFGTLRMFIHAVKFPDSLLRRIGMSKGSQKWRDWLTELSTGAHAPIDFRLLLTPDGFWVDMMSLPFAVQVVRRWRRNQNLPHGVLYPVYEPIFEMPKYLQDWKDNATPMVRTVGQRIDWTGLRAGGYLAARYMQYAEQHLPHLL